MQYDPKDQIEHDKTDQPPKPRHQCILLEILMHFLQDREKSGLNKDVEYTYKTDCKNVPDPKRKVGRRSSSRFTHTLR